MALKSGFVSRDATLQKREGRKYFANAQLSGTRMGPNQVLRKLLEENREMVRSREIARCLAEEKAAEGRPDQHYEQELGAYRVHSPKAIVVSHACNPPAEMLLDANRGEIYEVTNVKFGPVALRAVERGVGLGAGLLAVIWGDMMAKGEDGALARAEEIAKDIIEISPMVKEAVSDGRLAVVAASLGMVKNSLIRTTPEKAWMEKIRKEEEANRKLAAEGKKPKPLSRRKSRFIANESEGGIAAWNGLVGNNNQLLMRGVLDRGGRLFSIWSAMLVESDARVLLRDIFSPRANRHIFSIRNAGPAATMSTVEAFERFAHEGRGNGKRIPLLGVIGHGGNEAAEEVDVDAAIANVRENCEKIGASPAIRKLITEGEAGVVGLHYSLETGKAEVVFADGVDAPSEEDLNGEKFRVSNNP